MCIYRPIHPNTCFSLFLYVNITTATNKWERQVLLTQEALSSIAGAEHFYHFLCITISPTCFTLFAYPRTLGHLVRQKGLTPAKFFSTLSALKSSTGSRDRALRTEFHCSPSRNWYILKNLIPFCITLELFCNLFIWANTSHSGMKIEKALAFSTCAYSISIG